MRRWMAWALGTALAGHAASAKAAVCGGDAGDCPANAACVPSDGGTGTCAVLPCGGDAGVCPVNVYCGLEDGGLITDGAPGMCTLEPCVLSSDCANGAICDTSQNPYQCVQCISGADCPGDQICIPATHTCVEPPPADASVDGEAGAGDAAADGATRDAATDGSAGADASGDAASEAGSGMDATLPTEGGPSSNEAGTDGGDQGATLGGGAFDCAAGGEGGGAMAAAGLPWAVALLWGARKRRSKRR